MVNVLRNFEPLALPRPRGAHRHDVFSPKFWRRLTLYRRNAFEAWLMLEADPAIKISVKGLASWQSTGNAA
ncbi:hypothetical protein QFZ98_004774 [Paraburkholderia youngii]